MASVLFDIPLAFRHFRRNPGFTLIAVSALALGIGANTAIFSVVDAVLLSPLPYRDPAELALLWEVFPESNFEFVPSNEINLPQWERDYRAFSSISGFKLTEKSITRPGRPRRVVAWAVGPNLFDTLGVGVQLGRGFVLEDGQPGAARVAVSSHELWKSPRSAHRRLRTINGLENLNQQIRRQTRVVGIFPNPASALRWISAVLSEIHEEWLTGRQYLNLAHWEARGGSSPRPKLQKKTCIAFEVRWSIS